MACKGPLDVPPSEKSPRIEDVTFVPYILVGDEAYPLWTVLMLTYPGFNRRKLSPHNRSATTNCAIYVEHIRSHLEFCLKDGEYTNAKYYMHQIFELRPLAFYTTFSQYLVIKLFYKPSDGVNVLSR